MSRKIFLVLFLAINFIGMTPVNASSFRAMPLRLYLNSKDNTEVLKVMNEGDEKVAVQISVKEWSQDGGGKDQYSDTDKLIVFPKMTSIEAGAEKVFRVGYRGGEIIDEKTYRIFVQELPVSKPGESALKFALNLSLPVFVSPQNMQSVWAAHVVGIKQEALQVQVENSGNSHLMVNKIKAVGLDTKGKEVFSEEISGWYTLSGATRTFEVPVPYQKCLQASKVNIEIEAKDSKKHMEMPVAREMCSQRPKTEGDKTKANKSRMAR